MTTPDSLASVNRDLARKINEEARQNLNSPYAGKFVGIANGQVVAVGDTARDVVERLRRVEPDPTKCCCIEASADYAAVHEIWSLFQWR